MTIPQNDGFTVVLNRVTGQATYSADADTFSSEIDVFSNQVNTQATEMNATAIDVNADAALAQTAAEAAETSADYQGLWAGKTSAGTIGQSYSHLDYIWRLNVAVADLSTSEPAETNADWSYANGPLRSDLEVKKPVGSFDQSSMSALSIDGTSGVELRHSGEDLGTYANFSFSVAAQEGSTRGIATDSLGNFWAVGANSDSVYKYNQDGTYANFNFSVAAQESFPTGIAIDSLGNFWVVGVNSDSVYKYNPDGTYANDSFSIAAQEGSPSDIAIDSLGNFWVVGNNTNSVYKYTPAPSSVLAGRFGDVDLGVMQIDSETNQAAMVKPLKVKEPINDDEAASKNTVEVGDAALQTQITAINARQLLDFGKYAKFVDQKTNGTEGGAASAGTQDRELNTVSTNNIIGASLSSNNITLPAGTYYLKASAPAYGVTGHSAWVYNNTSSSTITSLIGTSEYLGGAEAVNTRSEIEGVFTVSVSTEIKLQHFTEGAFATRGLGRRADGPNVEIYSKVEVWKLD